MAAKKHRLVILIAKFSRLILRLRGGGSALPGLIAEKISPSFLADSLSSLPDGVVIVLGTNGKTTTTKMIADGLRSLGKKVLSNDTGSNYTRGLTSKVIEEISMAKGLDHDIAVFELDEIYATHFIRSFRPDFVVALNVMRDQLDRFGEIDITLGYIKKVMLSAKQKVIVNVDDPLILKAALDCNNVSYFGVSPKLVAQFPSDEQLLSLEARPRSKSPSPRLDTELSDFKMSQATFTISGQRYQADFETQGGYNYQNAAAAIALIRSVAPASPVGSVVAAVADVKPAFGRGEIIHYKNLEIEIMLVKNPGGFQQVLKRHTPSTPVMIAINDNYADGRDVSWLYDVNFSSLDDSVYTLVSGTRANDMALRLHYDDLEVSLVEPDIKAAIDRFLVSHKEGRHIVYATYTAMLDIRRTMRSYATIGGPL